MHNPLPLRERQRAQLVNEVRRVALQLFAERGFDAVTIDDIAARVGASRSTVFRVVDTKESLVLDPLLENISGMVAAFEARSDDDVVDALIAAMVDCMNSTKRDDFEMWRAAINTAPHLINRVNLVSPSDKATMMKVAAQHMGIDGAVDQRPALLITVALATSEYVFQTWINNQQHQAVPLTHQVEDALRTVLNPHWATPHPH